MDTTDMLKILRPLMLNFSESVSRLDKDEKKELLHLYASELSDIPPVVLALTVKALINSNLKWLPKIGEIREKAMEIKKQVDEQERLKRQIALHPEWYTPAQPQVEDKSERLIPVGRVLHRFANIIANGKALS